MTPGDDVAAQVVQLARGWVGTPYCHQAACRGAGADCLGLIRGIWSELLGRPAPPVPAYALDWAEAGPPDLLEAALAAHLRPAPLTEARPGDVLLFRLRLRGGGRHLGVQTVTSVREAAFVHAYGGHGVVESALSVPWRHRLTARFRFPMA